MGFTYDNEAVPSTPSADKVDEASELSPTNQYVSASEYNMLVNAAASINTIVADLRAAILAGQYTNLATNPSAAVSAATAIKLRSNAGSAEISQAGGAWDRLKPVAEIYVEDYCRRAGITDTTTQDCSAAILAASAACTDGAIQAVLKFDAKAYGVASEIKLTKPQVWEGSGNVNNNGTQLKALTANMRACVSMTQRVIFNRIGFVGNSLALVGCYNMSNGSRFYDCAATGGKVDGIFYPGEYDRTHHCSDNLDIATLRTVHPDNTIVADSDRNALNARAEITSGSAVVDFSGSPGLTGLSLTPGAATCAIFVQHPTTGAWMENPVLTVNSATRLTCQYAFGVSGTGLGFVVRNFAHGNMNLNSWFNLDVTGNGTIWRTSGLASDYSSFGAVRTTVSGTATIVSGNATASLSGGPDLRTMMIRRGDTLRVGSGSNERNFAILSVTDSDELVVFPTPSDNLSSQPYAILSGDGWHECNSSDININIVDGKGLWLHNANSHMAIDGFYGARVYGQQFDACGGWPIRIGMGTATAKAQFYGAYFEGTPRPGKFFLWYRGSGLLNTMPNMSENTTDPVGAFYTMGSLSAGGLHIDHTGMWSIYTGADAAARSQGFTSKVAAEHGKNFRVQGRSIYDQSTVVPVAGTTIEPSWDNISLAPSGDVVSTATPFTTLGGYRKIQFRVQSGAAGTILLQDDSVVSGTKLKLKTPKVRLGPGDAIDLYNDGTFLWEVGRHYSQLSVGDSSGTPGAATLNKVRGKSTIASGASSVVITNDRVSSGFIPRVVFTEDPGARYWVSAVDLTSFTVTLASAAASDLTFAWEVWP